MNRELADADDYIQYSDAQREMITESMAPLGQIREDAWFRQRQGRITRSVMDSTLI